jgi:hypothetical protein
LLAAEIAESADDGLFLAGEEELVDLVAELGREGEEG